MYCLVFNQLKIGFLGAGRMSQALIRSLIDSKLISNKEQIIASDIDNEQRKHITVC